MQSPDILRPLWFMPHRTQEPVMKVTRRSLFGRSVSAFALAASGTPGSGPGSMTARAESTPTGTSPSSFDAIGLAEQIRGKRITPDEAVEDTIHKIEAVNPRLNAVINKLYDRARQ